MTAPMRDFVRLIVSALVAAALLFAPTLGVSAACRHDTASVVTAVVFSAVQARAASSEADCVHRSAPRSSPADAGASCAGACTLPAAASVQAPAVHRPIEATRRIASFDVLAIGLAIPPLLDPPRR